MAEQNKNEQVENRPVFSWKALEFASYQRDSRWFIYVVLVAIILIIVFVWIKYWTAAGVVFAAGLAMMTASRVSPKKISCNLYRDGAVIGEKAYRFADLKSFWIIFGEHPTVRFLKPGRFTAQINMPIADEDPEQIRLFLSKYLPEEENRGEEVTDTISRWLRF